MYLNSDKMATGGSREAPIIKVDDGRTKLTKDKVENVMPIDELLGEIDDKPNFKNRFSCEFFVLRLTLIDSLL